MQTINAIAIDGPAASGKSTLGKRLADHLAYLFFDTGLMYRALTWAALTPSPLPTAHSPLPDEPSLTSLAQTVEIDILPPSQSDGRPCDVWVAGVDITWDIRRPEVDANVSVVAAYPGVRAALTQQQRRIGLRGKVVMVGRDIGAVVLPEAILKIYLTASPEERARRRCEELRQRSEPADYQSILSGILRRDQIDAARAVAPLRPAPDAVILDSDALTADQVLDAAIKRLPPSR